MDNLNVEKKYYIGSSKLGNWSSVYTYRPRNEHIFDEKGEIFAVISLNGPRGFNASTAGNLILDHLHETYFEGSDSSPLICLEKALVSAARKLAEIVDKDENIGDHGINLDIAAVAVVDNIGYFVNMGQGAIFLSRGERAIDVNSALKDPDGSGYLKSASTVIEEDDRLLLLTPQGEVAYTREEISKSLEQFDDILLKDKPLEDESSLSMILVGFDLDQAKLMKFRQVERPKEEVIIKKDDNKIKSFIASSDNTNGTSESEVKTFSERRNTVDTDENLDEVPVDQNLEDNGEIKDPIDVGSKNKLNIKNYKFDKSIFKNITKKLQGVTENFKNGGLVSQAKDKWNNLAPEGSDETTAVYILNRIKTVAKRVFDWVKTNIWEGFLQMDQGIYLRNARRGTNWRLIGTVAVIAFLLLAFSFNQISRSQEAARINREIEDTISKVMSDVDSIGPEITSILGQPDIYVSNKNQYQTQLTQLRNELGGLAEYELSEEQQSSIDTLNSRIDIENNRLNRIVTITEPEVLVDFITEAGEGVNLSDMEIVGNKIFITDASRGVIYETDTNGSSVIEVASGLTSPESIVLSQNDEIIGIDKSSQPFFSLNPNNGEVGRLAGIFGDGLNGGKQLESYSDRIYLSKDSSPAISYIAEEGAGYRGIIERFDGGDYLLAKDYEISDGKFYFLIPGKSVVRVFGNVVETFTLQGVSSQELTNINTATAIEVAGDYVIYGTPSNRSISFATKSRGTNTEISDYIGQIRYEGPQNTMSDINEIKIDLTSGNIYVIDDSKLLRFSIRDIKQFEY